MKILENENDDEIIKIIEELNESIEPKMVKNKITENKSIQIAKEFKTGSNSEEELSIDSKCQNLTKASHYYPEIQLRAKEKTIKLFKTKFSEQDFITLLLTKLLDNGISKVDTMELKHTLANYYSNEEYSCLFEDLSLKEQIEGSFVELDDALVFAHFAGLLSNPIQGTNTRMIWHPLENISPNYSMEYNLKMNKLVNDYLTEKCKQNHSNYCALEDDKTYYDSNLQEKVLVKKISPK